MTSAALPDSYRVAALDVPDVRFPTSDHLDGSDAMNPALRLLTARFGVPVRPHSGGVGLCARVRPESLKEYAFPDGPVRTACA